MKRFFFIAIIAFAAFNLNFVANGVKAFSQSEVCLAHGGACPHHHRDNALMDEHSGHEHHHGAHHGNNEKSLKCDCKKDYENSGLYTIPLPSQKSVRLLAWRTDLKEKSFESETFHSNQSLSPPETPPRA